MTVVQTRRSSTRIDLTAPPRFAGALDPLARLRVDPAFVRAVDALGGIELPGSRVRRVVSTIHKLNSWETANVLLAAGKLGLRRETAGLRVLFSFLTVKPPGVEVLRSLQPLSSIERVSIRLITGSWKEPETGDEENPLFAILELLAEATELGILDLGIEVLPRRADAVKSTTAHLRRWFTWLTDRLSKGARLPEPMLQFLIHLCMLEIALIEKRISRLAESIDPYDARGMARLMPVLSRYDQDVEHMKTVVGQIVTYRPFYDRALVLEGAIEAREVDRIRREMEQHPAGRPMAEILGAIRRNPILDRQLAMLVSAVQQVAVLRAQTLEEPDVPDILSVVASVADGFHEETPLRLRLEPEVVAEIWPVVSTWGVARRARNGLSLVYREERATEFMESDGLPRLPENPVERQHPELSIEELVRRQIWNEPFLLGILDNGKATSMTRTVPIIATLSRSVRVLEKICRVRGLHTGPTNQDVPRLLLMSPAHIPVGSLRPLIHVRYISRQDLERLAKSTGLLRREVQQEIRTYLRTLNTG